MSTNMDTGDIVRDTRDGKRYLFSWFDKETGQAHLLNSATNELVVVTWDTMIACFQNANPVVRMSQR